MVCIMVSSPSWHKSGQGSTGWTSATSRTSSCNRSGATSGTCLGHSANYPAVFSSKKTLDLYAIDFFDGKTGSKWSGEMELAQGAQYARELRLAGAVLPGVLPEQILDHGTLRHVAVQSSDAANLQQLRNLMDSNHGPDPGG